MRGNPAFGQWLKECRAQRDITQDVLAREVGCARSTIKKIEIGALRPSRQIAELLADRLGISADQRATWIATARISADPLRGGAQRSAAESLGTLPAPTVLIGRDRDLAHVCGKLTHADTHLITLAGPPGVGKTRLAIAAARASAAFFADRLCYVALAAAYDAATMIVAISQSLGLHETLRGSAIEAIARHVREQRMLLILDNLEQIADAAPVIANLLAHAPRLTILATSRVALRIAGEQLCPIVPLAFPTNPARVSDVSLAIIAASPAIALFVQRAQTVRPSFELTVHNAAPVIAICARLDGLPLAIELAAARIAIRSPCELLNDLNCPLPLLTHGACDLPQRQRTLRDAIGWSERLLGPAERRLFRAIGIFTGGFTLTAAAALLQHDQPEIGPHAIMDQLQALVSVSLVQVTETIGGELRFSLLETIRAYALEQLDTAGERALLQRQHALFCLALAELAAPYLHSGAQLEWLQRLDQEYDNLRAALLWSFTGAELGNEPAGLRSIGARLVVSLWYYWFLRGRLRDADYWLDRAAAPIVPAQLRAEALVRSGVIRYYAGGYAPVGQAALDGLALADQLGQSHSVALALATFGNASGASIREALLLAQALNDPWITACALAEQSVWGCDPQMRAADAAQGLALAQITGDRWLIARLRWALGMAVLDCGRPAAAEQQLSESLQLQQQLGNQLGVAYALLGLSIVAWFRADLRGMSTHQHARLAVERELGNDAGVAHTIGSLGTLALIQAEYQEAQALFNQSLAIYTVLADTQGCIRMHLHLAQIDLECGHYQLAELCLHGILERAQAHGFRAGIGQALEWLGVVAMARGDLVDAARWLQESMALAQADGNPFVLAINLRLSGELTRRQGHTQEAIRLLKLSVERYRTAGSLPGVAVAEAALGWALLDAGDLDHAQTLLSTSLGCFTQLNARTWAAGALEGLAAVAAEYRSWAEALRLWEIAAALRRQSGAQRWLVDERVQRQRQKQADNARRPM